MILSLISFLLCAAVSFLSTLFILAYCRGQLGMDHPDLVRKLHVKSVPRVGGLSIFFAFSILFLGLLLAGQLESREVLFIYAGCTLIFILGIADDFRPLGARVKLLGQILIAVLVYFAGLAITSFTYPVGSFSFQLGILGFFVTVFWLIAVPNIINLIDGIDGLASGVGIVLYLTLGYVSWQSGQGDISALSFGLAGALLGFLCFNFPPARIFLGDGGAYLMGFGVAALSTQSSNKGSIVAVLLVVIIALGLPIMDAVFALLRRAVRGFPLFRADAEHIHHRLTDMGLSDRRIVLGMYLLSVFFSLVGLSVFWTQGRTLPIALGIFFVTAVIAIRYLGYIWKWSDVRHQLQRVLGRRRDVEYALLHVKLLEMEVERCKTWDEFEDRLDRGLRSVGLRERRSGDEERLTIDLEIGAGMVWPLTVQEEDDHDSHWYRLAKCFLPCRKLALEKWPDETRDLRPGTTDKDA